MKYAILAYLVGINLFAFCRMGIDKRRARRNQYRISERALMLPAVFFGALGGYLGMRTFRHKTKHAIFYIGLPALLIVQLALGAFLLWRFH